LRKVKQPHQSQCLSNAGPLLKYLLIDNIGFVSVPEVKILCNDETGQKGMPDAFAVHEIKISLQHCIMKTSRKETTWQTLK
jgi:hypothetical protein